MDGHLRSSDVESRMSNTSSTYKNIIKEKDLQVQNLQKELEEKTRLYDLALAEDKKKEGRIDELCDLFDQNHQIFQKIIQERSSKA